MIFLKALCRKVKSLRLTAVISGDAEAKTFFRTVMALAYLPADMIRAQYIRLKNELPQQLQRKLRPFLTYFENYWLQIVKPHGFSVWGLSRRTNNILESYNSKLGHKLEAHPTAWDFLCEYA